MIDSLHSSFSEPTLAIHILRIRHLKRLSMKVEPGWAIVVKAPIRMSEKSIHTFIEDHRDWIERNSQKMNAFTPVSVSDLMLYKKIAKIYLPERVQQLAEKHHLTYTSVTCRHQKTRWGSCSHKNAINLNIELMRLPLPLQDYIILHELAHTVHKHHQKPFWDFLESLLPESKKLDKEMNRWKIGYNKRG